MFDTYNANAAPPAQPMEYPAVPPMDFVSWPDRGARLIRERGNKVVITATRRKDFAAPIRATIVVHRDSASPQTMARLQRILTLVERAELEQAAVRRVYNSIGRVLSGSVTVLRGR
jgi:hypothetical protein